MAIVRPEGLLCHCNIPLAPSEIEPATFRLVTLIECTTACLKLYTVAHQYRLCIVSPSWSLEFWGEYLEGFSTPAVEYSLHTLSYPGLTRAHSGDFIPLRLNSETVVMFHEVEPNIKRSCAFVCVLCCEVKWSESCEIESSCQTFTGLCTVRVTTAWPCSFWTISCYVKTLDTIP